jgi:hypothetical protein
MVRLKPTPTASNPSRNGFQGKPAARQSQRNHEISQESLTDFLNSPKRTRLTPEYDYAFLAPYEITARAKGVLLVSQWPEGISPFRAIHQLQSEAPSVDLFQISLVTSRAEVVAELWKEKLTRERNGRFGLEITLHGVKYLVSPLETIATNRPLRQWIDNWLNERRLSVEEFFAVGGKIHLLHCRQFLLQCGKSVRAVETFRGSCLVTSPQSMVALTDEVIAGISRWFMANQDDEGALPYKYWPSAGSYSKADNPIRRFMASVAFNRMANSLGRQDMRVAARKNLSHNLKRFYHYESGAGTITWQGSVKLGSLALAALAILESPFADSWAEELTQLRRTINSLWQPSGAFRTFLQPAERNDNQNFYPGEALLFWATSLQQRRDEQLLDQALKSYSHYRSHFLQNPNPAFVPWHTQALSILFKITGETSLRDFIFDMNDWLLPHQQWGASHDADYWGRFYTPAKPEYGPPHASATGVYLEGLVDALVLARDVNDTGRAKSYEFAINCGIRSLAQLQYRDELEAYYVHHKDRVLGAIRTESDNNEIRIDNLQHGLMALLKYRDLTTPQIVDADTPQSPKFRLSKAARMELT